MQKTAFDGWLSEQIGLVEGYPSLETEDIQEMRKVLRKTEEDIVRAFREANSNKSSLSKNNNSPSVMAN